MVKEIKKQKPILVEPRIKVAQAKPWIGIMMEIVLFCMALIGYLYCNTTALKMQISPVVIPIMAILSLGLMILIVWYKRVFFGILGGITLLGLIAFPVSFAIGKSLWLAIERFYNYIIYLLSLQEGFENYTNNYTISNFEDVLKNERLMNRNLYTVLILLSLLAALFFALALFRRIPVLCTFIVPVIGMVPFFFYGIVPHYVAFSVFLSAMIGCYSQSGVQWLARRRKRKREPMNLNKKDLKKKRSAKKPKVTIFTRLDFAGKHGVFGSVTAAVMLAVTLSTAGMIYSRPVFEMEKVRAALEQFSEDAINYIFRSTYEKNLHVAGYMEDGETLSLTVPNWRELSVASVYTKSEHPIYLRYRTMVDFDQNGWSIPDDAFMEEYSDSVERDFLEYTQYYEYLRLTAPSKNPKTAGLDALESEEEGYLLDHITVNPRYKVSDLLGLPTGVTTREPTSDYDDLEKEGDTILIAHDSPDNRSYTYQVAGPMLTSPIYLTNFQKTLDTYLELRMAHPDDPYMSREADYSAFVFNNYTTNTDEVNSMVEIIATDLTEKYTGQLQKVQAIERYFRENYSYSAQRIELIVSDKEEANSYDYLWNFIDNNPNKEGYCTLFATAMTSMVRAVGFPARVVTGYYAHPTERGPNDYAVSITDSDFHAWVEVYFDGMGWIPFEPTPDFGYKPNYYLLELVDNAQTPVYDENVNIEYDYSGQTDSDYVKYNNETLPEPTQKEEAEEEDEKDVYRDSVSSDLSMGGLSEKAILALKIILIILALMILLVLVEVWHRMIIKRARNLPPTEGVRKNYYLLLRLMQLMGFKFFEGEMLEEFATRADNLEFVSLSLREIAPILQKALYSEEEMTAEELAAVADYVAELDKTAFRRANPIKGFWYKLTLQKKPKHRTMIWSFK